MGRHGGRPSLIGITFLRELVVEFFERSIKAQHWVHALLRQNKACIDQHGAEGPDALQVLIKAPMVLPAYRGRDRLRPVP